MRTVADTARFPNAAPRRAGRIKNRLAGCVTAPLAACLPRRHAGAFGILMYHRVVDRPPGASEPTWNVTPDRFRRQLSGLLERGYEPWPLGRAIEVRRKGGRVPRNVFVVTFDDGYENNLTRAYPILRDLGVPATVFLATAYLDADAPFPSDDWPDAGSPSVPAECWRPLTSDQCRELSADGLVELGAHTHTHQDFRGRPELLRRDLQQCVQRLAREFAIESPAFAFPYGTKKLGFSGPPLNDVVRSLGLPCALTTEAELVLPSSDPFDWGRHTATEDDTAATLAAKLDGWYGIARDAWRLLKRFARTAGPNRAAVAVPACGGTH